MAPLLWILNEAIAAQQNALATFLAVDRDEAIATTSHVPFSRRGTAP